MTLQELILNPKLITSAIVVAVALTARAFAIRQILKQTDVSHDQKRRWNNTIRNGTNLIAFVVLLFIWLTEIQSFALSIAAFMVAIVLATKELIMCFVGSLFLASTRPFRIGDWVQIGHSYGEVVDSSWVSTTLFELESGSAGYGYSGKTLVIPNSQLLSATVTNMNYMRRYVSHCFRLQRDPLVNMNRLKPLLEARMAVYCAEFKDVAKRYNHMIEKRLNITIDGPSPSLRLGTSDTGKDVLTVNLFCPTEKALALQEQITTDFFDIWYRLKDAPEADLTDLAVQTPASSPA